MRGAALVIVLAACEHGQTPPGDDDVPDDGNVTCTMASSIAGELIEWDSLSTSPVGIEGATVTLSGDPTRSIVTPFSGRIDLCARPDLPLEFVVDNPDDVLDGTLSIDRDAVFNQFSARAFTGDRATSFYNEHGLIFDPAKAHVVVQQTADRLELALDLTHDTTLAANDDDGDGVLTWTAGATGRYVLFPNVEVGTTTGTLSGEPRGPRIVPINSGRLSMVVTFFVLVGP